MASVIARYVIPGRNAWPLCLAWKKIYQNLAIHIAAGRKTKQVQNSGRDIENTGAVDLAASRHTGGAHAQNAEMPVLHCGARCLHGNVIRQQSVRMESVVTQHHDGAVRAG